ncbi:MAG: hypothetical protein ACM3NH_03505 [Candidatus Saccharibacteria bacterium]
MGDFPYAKIIRQAYQLTKTRKVLWLFGLFLFLSDTPFLVSLYRVRGSAFEGGLESWWTELSAPGRYGSLLAGLAVLIAVVVMYFLCKAALIIAVNKFKDRKDIRFGEAVKSGREYFWRLLGVSASVGAGLLIVTAVLFVPVAYLAMSQSAARAWYLGGLAAVIFLPLLVIAMLLGILTPMFVTLFGLKVGNSFKASFDMLAANWSSILLLGIFLRLLGLIVFFVSLFLMILIATPVAILARVSYNTVGSAGMYAIFALLSVILTAIFLAVQAAVAAFNHTAWVLAFLEIVKPKKSSPEEEAAVVPEMISGG